MINNLPATTTGTAVVDRSQDPLEQFANSVAQTGQPLKFSKGRWFTGFGDNEKPADGLQLVADVPAIMLGWRKWVNKKIVDARVGYIADGFRPAARHDLDDLDEQTWERNSRGDAQDPWSLGTFLRLTDDNGEDYIYAAVSKGGQKAIWNLLQAFVKRRKTNPECCTPVVALEADSYRHRDFGKVDTPKLTIVDWRACDNAAAAIPDPDGSDDAEMSDTIPF
jgi:hypothetical protein